MAGVRAPAYLVEIKQAADSMGQDTLTVISFDSSLTGMAVVHDVLRRLEDSHCIKVRHQSGDDALNQNSVLDDSTIAWVLAQDGSTDDVFDLLAVLHDKQISTALSAYRSDEDPGAIVQEASVAAPLEAPTPVILAILKSLLAQSVHIRALKTEVKLMQLRQGGLANQIEQIDEELRLASLLQREFVPQDLPVVHGVDVHAMFRPAGYVSGDIYDVIKLDDDHIGVFLADAVGHGVPAALMTIVIKRALVTTEPSTDNPSGVRIIPPDEAISRLNNEMSRQISSRRGFPSACYCVINCRTLEASLARAGHPFPMVLKADGTRQYIKAEGMLLGIFPEGQFELAKWTMSPGDRLIIFSDGFEQAFPCEEKDEGPSSPDGVFNYGYASEFLDLANGPIEQAIERLSGRLDEQAGSLNQDDDLTVICASIPIDHRLAG